MSFGFPPLRSQTGHCPGFGVGVGFGGLGVGLGFGGLGVGLGFCGLGVGLGLPLCFGVGLAFGPSAQVLAVPRVSPMATSSVAEIFVIGLKIASRFFINYISFVAVGQIQSWRSPPASLRNVTRNTTLQLVIQYNNTGKPAIRLILLRSKTEAEPKGCLRNSSALVKPKSYKAGIECKILLNRHLRVRHFNFVLCCLSAIRKPGISNKFAGLG